MTWRHCYGSGVRHWVYMYPNGKISPLAICLIGPAWHTRWYGDQPEEWENMKALRVCYNCVKRGAPTDVME